MTRYSLEPTEALFSKMALIGCPFFTFSGPVEKSTAFWQWQLLAGKIIGWVNITSEQKIKKIRSENFITPGEA